MLKTPLFLILLLLSKIGFSQNYFEFGYNFGANATITKKVKTTENILWGYRNVSLPSTWNNFLQIGWGNDKNKVIFSFESGGLGVAYKAKIYTKNFPLKEFDPHPQEITYLDTKIQGSARSNSNLIKYSVLYQHSFYQFKRFNHFGVIGIGYLISYPQPRSGVIGKSFYSDSLGEVTNQISDFIYPIRRNNLYGIFGYRLTYQLNKHFNWNAQIMYNQGVFKMLHLDVYWEYNESKTGYSESAQQISYSRLSYFNFLTGITYNFNFKKKN